MFELNHVYNMDCMEGMREIPDKYFELAIVDPPYGINIPGKIGKGTDLKAFDDSKVPTREYFSSLARVSQNQLIWGGNYFCDHLGAFRCFIVWDKNNYGLTFADCELAWSSIDGVARIFKYRPQNMDGGKVHPTQKPIDLYKWLLSNYAKPGDKILDTHVGSGSSIIACIDMGFDYMGFEIDEDYYKAMQDRIYHFTRQEKLI